jgi:hypothetical protein
MSLLLFACVSRDERGHLKLWERHGFFRYEIGAMNYLQTLNCLPIPVFVSLLRIYVTNSYSASLKVKAYTIRE